MAKIFSVNFNKGSVLDRYGATATLGSTSKLRLDDKGRALLMDSNSTEPITYGNIAAINAIGTGEFTFVVGANVKNFLNHGSVYNTLMGKASTLGVDGFGINYLSNTLFRCIIVNSNLDATINFTNKANLFILTRNSVGLNTLYFNGIAVGSVTNGGDISNSVPLAIGYDGNTTSRTPKASIYLAEAYNHCLSTTEINDLVSDFMNQMSLFEPQQQEYINSSDLSSEKSNGLIASYNFKKVGNIVADTSGNNNTGTVKGLGIYGIKDGISFNMQDGVIQSAGNWAGTGDLTILGIIKPRSAGGGNLARVIENSKFVLRFNGANTLLLTSDGVTNASSSNNLINNTDNTYAITRTSTGITNFYINGVLSGTADQTSGTPIASSNLLIGNNTATGGVRGLDADLKDMKVYNRILSVQEIKNYHNNFARQLALKESFMYEPADGTFVIPQGWGRASGTFKIGEGITTLGNRTKYLEAITTSSLAIPSKTAYGTWEFDMYKALDAATIDVAITNPIISASALGGYRISFTSSKAVSFYESGAAVLFSTAGGYVQISTWYRVKITRSNNGVFTVYIKGGSFGTNNWTLISVVGGSGSNPVTENTYATSNYLQLILGVGDRFANLKVTKGIEL